MKEIGFLKAHRLSSKKDIELLLAEGNSFTEFPFRFIWSQQNSQLFDIKIAISIPKKRFAHAVDRNALKRRVREAFRLQYPNSEHPTAVEIHLLIVYVDSANRDYTTIETQIQKGLQKIFDSISQADA